MLRTPLAALALATSLALPVQADLAAMTDAERSAFREEVRAYLLENPEVLMEAIAVLERRQADTQAADDLALVAAHAEALRNDGHSWVGGNPDGDVTIVEFLDYRCGYCKKAHPEVAELLARDGNIRMVIKEYPILGEESVLASRFAIATMLVEGDAAYKTVSDALMELRGGVTEGAFRALAEDAGFEAQPVLDHMSDPAVDEIIAANRALGQTLGINGTPSFAFGDKMVRGYVPLDAMLEIVNELRKG